MASSVQEKETVRRDVFARIARTDPELIEAAAEVDRSLLRETLARSPMERLRAATRFRRTLARFRRVGTP